MNAIVETITHTHMPAHGCYDIESGMTIRQLLKRLRELGRENYGNMGGVVIGLSDNTSIEVRLQSASATNSSLMSSQRIQRVRWTADGEQTVRYYEW